MSIETNYIPVVSINHLSTILSDINDLDECGKYNHTICSNHTINNVANKRK